MEVIIIIIYVLGVLCYRTYLRFIAVINLCIFLSQTNGILKMAHLFLRHFTFLIHVNLLDEPKSMLIN